MNINMLRDEDNDAGFWAAAAATDPLALWTGAVLYRSIDAGSTYASSNVIAAEATMGTTTNALANFAGGNIPDEISSVNVALINGALSSTTYDGLLAGVNVAVIGDEIVYFRDATLEVDGSYTLRGLLRGRRGSEYAMAGHAVGDRFVLVSFTKLARVVQGTADIGSTRLYKAVSVGSSLAHTDAQSFTNEGVGLKPYAPVLLGGGRDAAGNFTLNWTRRSRISGEWRDLVDVPLGESSEAYAVEICASGGTVVRTVTGLTSPTTSYTTAQQTADFGSPQTAVYFRVYQISSVVGRGHAASGSAVAAGVIAPAPAPSPPVPIGSGGDGPYPYGTLPTETAGDMLTVIQDFYDAWKPVAVVDNPAVSGGKAIYFNESALTVSEGMGYGMLIAVLFAGHDTGAQDLFDALLKTVRANPAYGVVDNYTPLGVYLMDWKLYPLGTSAGEGWNAMDGDLDIAMALLMADRQWGSAGAWNYRNEALNTIAAMKAYNFKSDGTSMGMANANTSRTSDYMIGHFRAFQAATGDSFWTTVINRCYDLMELMQGTFSPVGLIPDFIMNTNTTPIPSTGGFGFGDGNLDADKYWYNACRIPWRLASDYVWSGDARNLAINQQLIDFFEAEAGGDALAIQAGWNLDGSVAGTGNTPAFHGPILAGAVAVGNTTFADLMWAWNTSHITTSYYDGELQLLSMVVASGNWWNPSSVAEPGTGTTDSPTPGPAPAPAPSGTDSNGDATIIALIAATVGSTITIPGDITYIIDAPIAVPAGKTLQAADGTAVTLKAASGYSGKIITFTGVTASLRNLTIDGNYVSRTAHEGLEAASAVYITGGSAVSVEHVKFLNCPSFGVWAYNSADLSIRYNEFDEVYQPIRIDGADLSSAGTVDGNLMTNTTAFKSIQHLDAIGTNGLSVVNNTMSGAGLLEPTSHGFEGTWGNSIYLYNSSDYNVENNTAGSNHWSAIVSGAGCANGTIQHNEFSSGTNSVAAVWVEQPGADYVTIDRNLINGDVSCGDTGGNHVTITNNVINALEIGINLNSGCTDALVQYNTITGVGSGMGMYLWEKSTPGIDVQVLNNSITAFSEGVLINNSGGVGTVYGLTVTDNNLAGNTTTVYIPGAIVVDGSCNIQS